MNPCKLYIRLTFNKLEKKILQGYFTFIVISCLNIPSSSKHRWFSGRMLACHAGGPGSIPGRCRNILLPIFVNFTFHIVYIALPLVLKGVHLRTLKVFIHFSLVHWTTWQQGRKISPPNFSIQLNITPMPHPLLFFLSHDSSQQRRWFKM